MSRFINKPHACTYLLASLVFASGGAQQTIRETLADNVVYEKFILKVKPTFEHGEQKAKNPKFGGIYNLIKDVSICINTTEKHYQHSGMELYVDNFVKEGRERNGADYFDLPDSLVQNIDYNFNGRNSILGGVAVPNGAYALDLRHTSAGNQTFNSVELVVTSGQISDVFEQINDTALKDLTIEVYGVELFHNNQSRQRLAIDRQRYAELKPRKDARKIQDTAVINTFTLEPLGAASDGVNLSDIVIVQLDEAGMPVAFDNENEIVSVMIGEQEFYQNPIWNIRKDQNEARIEPVPPNVLIIPLVQFASGFGGLTPAELFAGATLELKANKNDGQTGETCLHVLKSYTHKLSARAV